MCSSTVSVLEEQQVTLIVTQNEVCCYISLILFKSEMAYSIIVCVCVCVCVCDGVNRVFDCE